jgi:hypothetical protein
MVDFTLTDEQKVLRELAHDFATKESIGARGQSRSHDLAHRRRGGRSPRRRGGSTIARELVDHSQIVQLECLRRGIWGTKSLWGRVVTYPGG